MAKAILIALDVEIVPSYTFGRIKLRDMRGGVRS